MYHFKHWKIQHLILDKRASSTVPIGEIPSVLRQQVALTYMYPLSFQTVLTLDNAVPTIFHEALSPPKRGFQKGPR